MKQLLSLTWLLLFMLAGNSSYSQYSISGYLDTPSQSKKVYLSLLRYDEQRAMSQSQNLFSTLTDSTGYFSFSGKLLSEENKLYRIHTNIKEGSQGLDLVDTDEIKNFHNFIFSNTDTIVFRKSKDHWFSMSENTNSIDYEFRELKSYKRKLLAEFSEIKNKEAKIQSLSQLLSDLKAYVIKTQVHPLVKLILLSEIQESILKKDFENDPAFYFGLKSELNSYYSNASYALQFEELVSDLSLSETQQQLTFYKRLVYLLSFVILALMLCVFFLWKQVSRSKKNSGNESINLTNQEEKIARLILQEKSNKEIAAELFISLSTVKTHIRNLYAKYEVNNRQQFADKIKNHPRD